MSIKKHLILIAVCIGLWAGFYVVTVPSNYMTAWNDAEKTLLCVLTFFAILPFTVFVLALFMRGDYFITGLWLGVYGSVGIFLLDFIVVGLIEGKGIGFIFTHWPQSIGYLEAAIIGPLLGMAMKKGMKA